MYSILIVPAFWLLGKRKNHRVFSHKSVPDIAKAIFTDWHIEAKLKIDAGSYPKLEYRVQYGESDLDFVRRQLADVGISLFFEHDGAKTSVVLSDKPHTADPKHTLSPFLRSSSGAEGQDHFSHVSITNDVAAGKVTMTDHDFRRPTYTLAGTHAGEGGDAQLEEHHYEPGHSKRRVRGRRGNARGRQRRRL